MSPVTHWENGEAIQGRGLKARHTPDLPSVPEWYNSALCAQTDAEAFFPKKGGSTREAKNVCIVCPVRPECLQYAVDNDERFGIWGGMTERERRKIKRRIHVAVTKVCQGCGKDMPASGVSKFCGELCRERTKRRNERAA